MIEKIRTCMKMALNLPESSSSVITEATTADDLPAWTSVAHLSLVLELEKSFDVQFGNDEIASLGSVSAIAAALRRRGVT